MLFTSKTEDGKRYAIELNKTKANEGEIRVRSWRATNNSKKPNTDDTTPLYNIRANKLGTQVVCYARVFGPDPVVLFKVTKDAITVKIDGAIAGNGTTKYPLTADEIQKIEGFIRECGFKELAT